MIDLRPFCIPLVIALCGAPAHAEPDATLVVVGAEDTDAIPAVAADAAALQKELANRAWRFLPHEEAARAIERVLPLPRAPSPSLAVVMGDARRAFYYEQDSAKARALLERIRRETTDCVEYRESTLFLARLALA